MPLVLLLLDVPGEVGTQEEYSRKMVVRVGLGEAGRIDGPLRDGMET